MDRASAYCRLHRRNRPSCRIAAFSGHSSRYLCLEDVKLFPWYHPVCRRLFYYDQRQSVSQQKKNMEFKKTVAGKYSSCFYSIYFLAVFLWILPNHGGGKYSFWKYGIYKKNDGLYKPPLFSSCGIFPC